MDIVGPSRVVSFSCFSCTKCMTKKYVEGSDSGHDVYCTHPSVLTEDINKKFIADSSWTTPEWCPEIDKKILDKLTELGISHGM